MSCPPQPAWYQETLATCKVDPEEAMLKSLAVTRRGNATRALSDGVAVSLGAAVAQTAGVIAIATGVGILFAPVLMTVGVSLPVLAAEWKQRPEHARQVTYHAAMKVIALTEQTIQGLYYTPGTDPKWEVVCQQVTTLRT